MATDRKPSVEWTKGLSEKEKEELLSLLPNSYILKRLKTLVEEKQRNSLLQETNQDDYDTPSWAFKQADRNGYRRAIKDILNLLSFI